MNKILVFTTIVVSILLFNGCEVANTHLGMPEQGTLSDIGSSTLAKGNSQTGYAYSNTGTEIEFECGDNDFATLNYTLWAGQHNDAGTVVITNDEDNIYVTYNTNETADLSQVHVYFWTNEADIPTKRPAPGHADYVVEDINADSYTVTIPAVIECDAVIYISAHAALIADDASDVDEAGDGSNDGETAYAGGNNVLDGFPKGQGAWWGYVTYTVICCENDSESDGDDESCETAFAVGDMTLIEVGVTNNRWGWQITVNDGDNNITTPIYAGAGQNDLTKGTRVGDLNYSYDGSELLVTFEMFDGYTMDETHLYAGNEYTSTIAPGLFGNLHENLDGASNDSYTITLADDGDNKIYMIAHAVVCGTF